ncbi:MAG: mannonate dehydratase [Pseudomonadota bacterium]
MRETMRWYGPSDPVKLDYIRHAGAVGVVSALHDCPIGQVWPVEKIAKHKARIQNAGLTWDVVESVPVPQEIKTGRAGRDEAIATFISSMRNLAASGVHTICYNFMPVVDWTRTTLSHRMPSGALALGYDHTDFAAYDVYILQRPNADHDYPHDVLAEAQTRAASMSEDDIAALEHIIIAGLPGGQPGFAARNDILERIADFDGISGDEMRENLRIFQDAVSDAASSIGSRICIHPDDPPFPVFGLPRVVSTASDLTNMFSAVPRQENGLTLCTGSLGANEKNDCVAMAKEHADRTHFLHLRNVEKTREKTFHESDHLDGDVDMIAVIQTMLQEETRRKKDGREDAEIPIRPDHGHLMMHELDADNQSNPGYSAIGRMRGLAEIRGVARTFAKISASEA